VAGRAGSRREGSCCESRIVTSPLQEVEHGQEESTHGG